MGFQGACFLPLPVLYFQAPTASIPSSPSPLHPALRQDGGRDQEPRKVGNLGQPWPLKGQGAQNSEAVSFSQTLIKQEFVEGSEVLPHAKAQT